MSAQLYPMTVEQKAFLNCVRWLECDFGEKVFVMDIDFEESTLSLYGSQRDNAAFNKKLKQMVLNCRTEEERAWGD